MVARATSDKAAAPLALDESDRPPRKGTPCRCPPCKRPAVLFGRVYGMDSRTPKIRFIPERRPFCKIHAIANEFALEPYRCPSASCLRRRFLASGGWLNYRERPESTFVYLPLRATIEDSPDDGSPPRRPLPRMISNLKCPRCGTRLRHVR